MEQCKPEGDKDREEKEEGNIIISVLCSFLPCNVKHFIHFKNPIKEIVYVFCVQMYTWNIFKYRVLPGRVPASAICKL